MVAGRTPYPSIGANLLLGFFLLACTACSEEQKSEISEDDVDITIHIHTTHHVPASEFASPVVEAVRSAILDADGTISTPPTKVEGQVNNKTLDFHVQLVPGMYLGSKTPYSPAQAPSTLESMQPHCKLVSLSRNLPLD